MHNLTYQQLAFLAGMSEATANFAGYARMELINIICQTFKPNT